RATRTCSSSSRSSIRRLRGIRADPGTAKRCRRPLRRVEPRLDGREGHMPDPPNGDRASTFLPRRTATKSYRGADAATPEPLARSADVPRSAGGCAGGEAGSGSPAFAIRTSIDALEISRAAPAERVHRSETTRARPVEPFAFRLFPVTLITTCEETLFSNKQPPPDRGSGGGCRVRRRSAGHYAAGMRMWGCSCRIIQRAEPMVEVTELPTAVAVTWFPLTPSVLAPVAPAPADTPNATLFAVAVTGARLS